MSDSDLSTALTDFFNSLNDVLNQPEDPAVRKLAALSGDSLATQIRYLDSRVGDLREMANDQIINAAEDINQLVTEIGKLNVQIIEMELGGSHGQRSGRSAGQTRRGSPRPGRAL